MVKMFYALFITVIFTGKVSADGGGGSGNIASLMSFGMGMMGAGEPMSLKSIASFGLDVMGVTEKLNEVEQQLQNHHKNLMDTFNEATTTATNAFTSNINMIMNVVDEHALCGFFAELIPEAREKGFGNNTCIEGIKTKKHHVGTLLMKDGSLHYQIPMNMVAEPEDDRGESRLFNSSFAFADISVTFGWEFESSGGVWQRKGTMEMVFKGPNRVTVSATVPKSRMLLEEMISRHECFMKVEAVEVVLGDDVEVTAVNYDSFVKSWFVEDSVVKSLFDNVQGGTEYLVRGMIDDMKGFLSSHLKKTLKAVVAPATSRTDVFCENTFTTAEPIKCEEIEDNGEYD